MDFSHSRAQLTFHFDIHTVWLRMPKSQAKEAKVQPLLRPTVSRLHRTLKGPTKSLSFLKSSSFWSSTQVTKGGGSRYALECWRS